MPPSELTPQHANPLITGSQKNETQLISDFVRSRMTSTLFTTHNQVQSRGQIAMEFDSFFKHVQQQVWFLDSVIWRRHFQSPKDRDKARACSCCGKEEDNSEKKIKPKDILQREMEQIQQSRKRKRSSDDESSPSNCKLMINPPELLCKNCYTLYEHRNQQLCLLYRLCGVSNQRKRSKTTQ